MIAIPVSYRLYNKHQSQQTLYSFQNAALVFGGTPLSFVTTLSKGPQESQELNYLLALLSHSEVGASSGFIYRDKV